MREEVAFISVEFQLSERTACKLLGVERSSYRYAPRPDRNIELREALVKLARRKPRYGYRGLHVLLETKMVDVATTGHKDGLSCASPDLHTSEKLNGSLDNLMVNNRVESPDSC